MSTIEYLNELERLKSEGKDVGDARRAIEGRVFEEADQRIDDFWARKRLKLIEEMPLPKGKVNPDHYQVIKVRK